MRLGKISQALEGSGAKLSGLRQPSSHQFVVLIVSILAVLVLAVMAGPEDARHLEFLEGGLVTWMSGLFMALTSALAFACALVHSSGFSKGRLFWVLVGGAFSFFFFDEFLQIHERLGAVVDGSAVGVPEGVRGWNDLFVIGYGLVGIAVSIGFLPEILTCPAVAKWLGIGFAFFVVHTAIDSLVTDPTSTSMILEESAKIFATFSFGIATLERLVSLTSNEP